MRVRQRSLEGGWYPTNERDVKSAVQEWEKDMVAEPEQVCGAGIAPHAGWYFSGRLAWDTVRRARKDTQTVIIAGGHRPRGSSVLFAAEDAFETPVGSLATDREFANAFGAYVPLEPDAWADNTVEVLLPLVRLRFPEARLLWLRVPNDETSEGLGTVVARVAGELGRCVFFLASTDLTHYGPNYDFSPKGLGPSAQDWVQNVNDKGIIDAFLALDAAGVIRRGNRDKAACSSGAAAAAIGFARAAGFVNAKLCGYYTSRDIQVSDSFVGYCSVVYG